MEVFLFEFVLFVFALALRYLHRLFEACTLIANAISDRRFETEVDSILRPPWTKWTHIAVIAASCGTLAHAAWIDGFGALAAEAAGFAVGYWLFGYWPVPASSSAHFVSLIHRSLKSRAKPNPDGAPPKSPADLAARIEASLHGKLSG